MLRKLDAEALAKFQGLHKIIGATKANHTSTDVDMAKTGLTNEQYKELERLQKKPKKELTEEDKKRLEEAKEKKKNADAAISILRGISIRLPLLMYGAELADENQDITLENFAELIDNQSWEEFMPRGVTKELFKEFVPYYDPDMFRAVGRNYRELVRQADQLPPMERVKAVSRIFSYFRNPDKETVLTPWRVVNMHIGDCIGGYVFFDEAMTTQIGNPIQQQMYSAIHASMVKTMMDKGMPEAAANAAATAAIEKAGGISMAVSMGAPGVYHTPQTNLGFYHESNFNLTSRLVATLGIRYDLMHTSIHYQSAAFMAMTANMMGQKATFTLKSALDGKAKDDYNQILPKIGITYQLDDQQSNLYATVSKGYRAGGYNIQMFSDILQTELNAHRQQAMRGDYDVPHTPEDYEKVNQTISYKPEVSWNYEVGAHLNLFDHALHFDLGAFYMKVKNQQLSVMAGNYGFGRMMVNAGKSHSCGIEAALRGQLANGKLDWMLNYGYTRAEFDEYTDGEGDKAVSYKDKKVPYVPEHTLSAMADYRLQFDSSLLRSMVLGANVNMQGKTYWDNANSYGQDIYAVLGAHVAFDLGKVQLNLWGKNLTDTNYNTFAVDNAATGKREYFAQRGNPFQCGVDVSFRF